METAKYLELIQIEVNKLPDFVKQFNLGTNHSLTTTYQKFDASSIGYVKKISLLLQIMLMLLRIHQPTYVAMT